MATCSLYLTLKIILEVIPWIFQWEGSNLIQGILRINFAPLEHMWKILLLGTHLTHPFNSYTDACSRHITPASYSFPSHKHTANSTWHNTHHSLGHQDHYNVFSQRYARKNTHSSPTQLGTIVQSEAQSILVSYPCFLKVSRQIQRWCCNNLCGHKKYFKIFSKCIPKFVQSLKLTLGAPGWLIW